MITIRVKKVLFILLLTGLAQLCTGFEIPCPDQIQMIRFNTTSMSADKFEKDKILEFVQDLENTVQVENAEVSVPEDHNFHNVVTLIWENGQKETFCFHKLDDRWYMRDKDGIVYQNAEFICNYIEIVDVRQQSDVTIILNLPDTELLAFWPGDELLDERYVFAVQMRTLLDSGITEQEAEETVRDRMLRDMQWYQYAVENGYQIDNEALQEYMKRYIEDIKNAQNCEEFTDRLDSLGMTVTQYMEKQKELYRISETIQYLYNSKYSEYQHGSDYIGETYCNDFIEYWNHFQMDVLQPEMSEYDFSDFEEKLDEASEFFHSLEQ